MSDESEAGPSHLGTPPKKRKRLVKFNQDWKKTFFWLHEGKNEYYAKCTVCNNFIFSISHGGENDVRRHMNSTKHKLNLSASSQTSKLTNYFAKPNTKEEQVNIAAETTFSYHSCIHSHSYRSAGCASSLFKGMFLDSKIASQYSCGKTKSNAIITKVLGPFSKTILKRNLVHDLSFAIMTDASNKGNIKTFPLIIRYFQKSKGIQTSLLAFFSLESEKALDIAAALKQKLESSNLSLNNISCYCADNASVNFGKNNSVFTELKKGNSNLIAMGCNAHILHNTAKKASNALKYDIESTVIKIYNEFSSSTKKTTLLKEFFEWAETEWLEILRHVPTRWLTLLPAIERLILNFKPIKSYFMSQNSISPLLRLFFEDDLALAYLGFLMNVFSTFQPILKQLQDDGPLIVELFDIMEKLRTSLIEKESQEFYGHIARTELRNSCNDEGVRRFKTDAKNLFYIAINYLEKWFNFDENKFVCLRPIRLLEEPLFSDLTKIVDTFNIKSIDEDLLFEEFTLLKAFIKGMNDEEKDYTVDKKWVSFFSKNPETNNLYKIVSFVLSIPHSNAASERVFSLMTIAWRKDRNNLLLKNLEAELMVKENYGLSCSEFIKYLNNSSDGREILKLCKSSEKYTKDESKQV